MSKDDALTLSEQQSLACYEAAIERGLQTFVEVGRALLAIRDGRLYRAQHPTFEAYCRQRWGMTRRYANLHIAAAEVVLNLGTIVPKLPANEAQARPLTHLEPDQQRAAWQQAVETAPAGRVTAAHVAQVVATLEEADRPPPGRRPLTEAADYDGDEWYTPVEYLAAARAVMGDLDLDPASCAAAQQVVQARAFFTKQDDGLARPWRGRVWLNPPYSAPQPFVAKLCAAYAAGQVSQALVLVNNATDTVWFHTLLGHFPACFTRGRVVFWHPERQGGGPRQGQTIFYLGPHVAAFRAEFTRFGIVVVALAGE